MNSHHTPASISNLIACTYCGHEHHLKSETLHRIQVRCSRCKLLLTQQPYARFMHLDPAVYRHPLDTEAQDQLKVLPGVDAIIRKLLDFSQEVYGESFFAANCLLASETQYGDLYAKLAIACHTLGLNFQPRLFIAPSGLLPGNGWQTFSGGLERPFIVFPVNLLEKLEEHEILALLGHEVGHFHCNHHALKVAADFLQLLMGKQLRKNPLSSWLDNLTPPLLNALLSWRRKADFTADRSSLLVLQNPQQMAELLMKLAGHQFPGRGNFQEFIQQARLLDRTTQLQWLEKNWPLQIFEPLPNFAVWRMSELLIWTSEDLMQSYGYTKILKVFAVS